MMDFLIKAFVVWSCSFYLCVRGSMDSLPPIYEMDDFDKCQLDTNDYCEVKIKMTPLNNESFVWRMLQDIKKNPKLFDHDYLKRLKCLPNTEDLNHNKSIITFVNKLNKQYANLDLRFTVENMSCKKNDYVDLHDYYEYTFLSCLLIYLFFLGYATYVDYKNELNANKYLKSFSIMYNWKLALERNRNPDFQKLKAMQGSRSISMFFVVLCHAQLKFGSTYIKNTDYLELLFHNFFVFNLFTLDLYIVQVFFIISAWLLALQIHDVVEKTGQFSIKTVYKILVNRLIRLWPGLAIMVAIHRSKMAFKLYNGPLIGLLKMDNRNCNTNWWQTLFFINNIIINPNEVCNIGTWYVSADTQLYIFSLLLFYLLIKYNLGIKTLVAVLLSVIIGYGGIIFYNNVDMIIQIGVETSSIEYLINSHAMKILYFSTIGSASTFILGLCLGSIYYRVRNKDIFNNKMMVTAFYASAVLPFLIIWFTSSNYNFKGVTGAVTGALLKPLYALGVGFFILGISQNQGGMVKNICELRFFEIMSNFTYCTYLFHFAIVFEKMFSQTSILNLSVYSLGYILVTDIFKSFFVGFVMYFVIEKPIHNIQKLCGPKIIISDAKKNS